MVIYFIYLHVTDLVSSATLAHVVFEAFHAVYRLICPESGKYRPHQKIFLPKGIQSNAKKPKIVGGERFILLWLFYVNVDHFSRKYCDECNNSYATDRAHWAVCSRKDVPCTYPGQQTNTIHRNTDGYLRCIRCDYRVKKDENMKVSKF